MVRDKKGSDESQPEIQVASSEIVVDDSDQCSEEREYLMGLLLDPDYDFFKMPTKEEIKAMFPNAW